MIEYYTVPSTDGTTVKRAYVHSCDESLLFLLANVSIDLFGSRHQSTIDTGVEIFLRTFNSLPNQTTERRLRDSLNSVRMQGPLGIPAGGVLSTKPGRGEVLFVILCAFMDGKTVTTCNIGPYQLRVFRNEEEVFSSRTDVCDVEYKETRIITGTDGISLGGNSGDASAIVSEEFVCESGDYIVLASYRLFALCDKHLILKALTHSDCSRYLCECRGNNEDILTDSAIVYKVP